MKDLCQICDEEIIHDQCPNCTPKLAELAYEVMKKGINPIVVQDVGPFESHLSQQIGDEEESEQDESTDWDDWDAIPWFGYVPD